MEVVTRVDVLERCVASFLSIHGYSFVVMIVVRTGLIRIWNVMDIALDFV